MSLPSSVQIKMLRTIVAMCFSTKRNVKITAHCDVTPYSVADVSWHFRITRSLHLQGKRISTINVSF
jgi:hypothetical protein